MPQSLATVHIHLVFSTKGRIPFLRDSGLRGEMHAYLGGVSGNLDCPPTIVGGPEDHVHVLGHLSRTVSLADWAKEIKRVSSGWIKEREPKLRDFAWQAGYGAFAVSVSNLDRVRTYIAEQEKHHRKLSFQDEYRAFLRKHGVDWDERYVWD